MNDTLKWYMSDIYKWTFVGENGSHFPWCLHEKVKIHSFHNDYVCHILKYSFMVSLTASVMFQIKN